MLHTKGSSSSPMGWAPSWQPPASIAVSVRPAGYWGRLSRGAPSWPTWRAAQWACRDFRLNRTPGWSRWGLPPCSARPSSFCSLGRSSARADAVRRDLHDYPTSSAAASRCRRPVRCDPAMTQHAAGNRHVIRQRFGHDDVGAQVHTVSHPDVTEELCADPGVQVTPDDRANTREVPLTDVVQPHERAVVADDRTCTNDDPEGVADDQASADGGASGDLGTSHRATNVAHDKAEGGQVVQVEPAADPVEEHRVKAGVQTEDGDLSEPRRLLRGQRSGIVT